MWVDSKGEQFVCVVDFAESPLLLWSFHLEHPDNSESSMEQFMKPASKTYSN